VEKQSVFVESIDADNNFISLRYVAELFQSDTDDLLELSGELTNICYVEL